MPSLFGNRQIELRLSREDRALLTRLVAAIERPVLEIHVMHHVVGPIQLDHSGSLTLRPGVGPAVRGVLTIDGKDWLIMQTIKDTETKVVSVRWIDALGNPAKQDSMTFELADANTCTLEVAADGQSATLRPIQEAGHLGTGQVKVTGHTEGETDDVALGDYEVVGGEAVTGVVVFT